MFQDEIDVALQHIREGQFHCDFGIDPLRLRECIDLIHTTYPETHYCVIADWVWNDIILNRDQVVKFNQAENVPAFLYSRSIIIDSEQRGFTSVLTSFQKRFTRNSLFETQNRIYLLCGPGRRSQLSYEAYQFISSRSLISFLNDSTYDH